MEDTLEDLESKLIYRPIDVEGVLVGGGRS